MWVHPESNNSVEFLFGGKGDPKRYKRKRNERSMVNRAHFASIGELQDSSPSHSPLTQAILTVL